MIRKHRKARGLTQLSLATKAQVSLATVQNIEADNANPELQTLKQLLAAMNLSLKITEDEMNLDKLIVHGLPLFSNKTKSRIVPNRYTLISELNLIVPYLKLIKARERKALIAFIIAIRDHFDSVWKLLNPELRKWADKNKSIDVVKLRRLSVQNLASYL